MPAAALAHDPDNVGAHAGGAAAKPCHSGGCDNTNKYKGSCVTAGSLTYCEQPVSEPGDPGEPLEP